ncbi:putative pentatricopeptide repeat domain-protein [Phialemonium atrogriseum]|uniref:Pentatricopeptide repeat domain-protein n=1 Tax=Phialemonium atrogriseum TaxID=1093897 RepID=A0AAJ0C6P0_9PEZI|nr:putative pentatricopeptide repeat domain-protein [Phialemonium atrogriseum]KAK1770965.1 putative pentatricopeptide repeat domain-protein [Phialemonium atrogriseum]
MRLLSSRRRDNSLDNEPGAAADADAASRDGRPSPSKGVVSPVTLVDRLVTLPVRQHGPRESVLVEPRIEYPHRRETQRSERRNHQGITAQLRLERIRAAQSAPPPNWRAVLHTLTVWTPKYSEDTVEVVLPEDAASLLFSDAVDNIWDIQSRTGVTMKIESGAAKDGPQTLLLSGDRRAIDKAIEDILSVTKKITSVLLSRPVDRSGSLYPLEGQETSSTPPVSIWDGQTSFARPYALTRRAEDIPRPSSWTKRSLEEYVIALTMGRLPPTLASTIYPKGMSHDEAVIQQLHQTFNDPTARPALSSSAFKMALAFMARKGHTFRPHSRALFVRMEMFGMRMDTEVFNLLAESAVKARDLRSFSMTTNLMVKRGHRPNLRTWILFLRLIKSEEVKRYILHAMNHTELLDSPSAAREVAKEMASHDIDRAIQQGKDLQTFLTDQDALYGSDWLSRDAGNKIIEILGRHGRFDDCGDFLDVMSRSIPGGPDVVALNTALTHCKVQNDLHRAVDLLERFDNSNNSNNTAEQQQRGAAVPDAITYHLLSELGWRHKLPHVTGLVWRYSCLVNKTSYRMRRRAADLLRKGAGAATASSSSTATAGDGNGDGDDDAHTIQALLVNEVTSDYAEAGSDPAVRDNPDADADADDPMRQMMQWYRRRHRDWEPAAPLSALLREALARDARLLRVRRRRRLGASSSAGAEGGEEEEEEEQDIVVGPVALPTRRRRRVWGGGGDADASVRG